MNNQCSSLAELIARNGETQSGDDGISALEAPANRFGLGVIKQCQLPDNDADSGTERNLTC